MTPFDPTENFKINRILLLAIGLWPYQRSKLVLVQLILNTAILVSFVTFQLTAFLTMECTPEIFIKICSPTLSFIMYIVEYNYFWANGRAIKYLMEQLQQICNELRDENEIAIIKKYGRIAKFYTTGLTWVCLSSIFCLTFLSVWPHILDIILSVNESSVPRSTQFMTEYFVDPEGYIYLILLHMDASCSIGIVVAIATGAMYISHFKHTCGMFRIASYRLEQALSNGIRWKIESKSEIKIHKEIIYAVDIHRKAMNYTELLMTTFEGLFLFLIVTGVISLSLTLFRVSRIYAAQVFQIVIFGGDIDELILYISYTTVTLIYMFIGNYVGQEVMDHNNQVFITAYNIQWYEAPLRTQRMIMFLLQRGNKVFTLNISGLFILSLETFASLLSVSISYLTVIFSVQQ